MTCIVGIADPITSAVYIGGDSNAYGENVIQPRRDHKVFWVEGVSSSEAILIGATTSFRAIQLLQFELGPRLKKIPQAAWDAEDCMFRYMVTEFIPAVRAVFKEGGFARTTDGGVEIGGNFLVGVGPYLFEVDSDYQICIPARNYAAVGAGYQYALGSLFQQRLDEVTPDGAVRSAILTAMEFSHVVGGPIVIKSTKD